MNYTQKSGQLTIEMCDMSVVEYMNHISRNACGIGEQHERNKKSFMGYRRFNIKQF